MIDYTDMLAQFDVVMVDVYPDRWLCDAADFSEYISKPPGRSAMIDHIGYSMMCGDIKKVLATDDYLFQQEDGYIGVDEWIERNPAAKIAVYAEHPNDARYYLYDREQED